MGQLKIGPQSNVRQIEPLRPLKGLAGDRRVRADDAPPGWFDRLKLSPAHVELIKACAENLLRKTDGAAAAQIAQRFAPAAQLAREPAPELEGVPLAPAPARLDAIASGMRRLMLILIVAALLPNLTAAAFWLGLIAPPWPQHAPPAEIHAAMATAPPPVLSAPETLDATEGGGVPFAIALDGTDGVPPGSVIVVRGLPRGSAFSSGEARGETGWMLRRDEIGDLRLALPTDADGRYRLTIQLLAPNNGILADAHTLLQVAPETARTAAIPPQDAPSAPVEAAKPDVAADDVTGAITGGEDADNDSGAVSEPDVPSLPDRRPGPEPTAAGGKTGWVRPTAYVNLRDAPSSSGTVLGTIAKGKKLRVLDRKSGWVKVASPENAKSGWIYSGNTTALP